jgi:hypothetical protein
LDGARMPMPVFRISMTASLALRTSGNLAVATVVGMRGARRMVTSVMMPSVPSAPTNNFVVSNPADDLRARRRVLITSPDGRTTVCRKFSVRTAHRQYRGSPRSGTIRLSPYRTALHWLWERSISIGLEDCRGGADFRSSRCLACRQWSQ